MPEFTWSFWTIGTVVLFVIACSFVEAEYGIAYDIRNHLGIKRILLTLTHAATLLAFCIVLFNLVTFGVTAAYVTLDNTNNDTKISDADFVKEKFDFESGKAYTLTLGSLSGGSSTTTTFYARGGTISSASTAILTIPFVHDGIEHDISVPLDTANIQTTDKLPPSVTLYLNPDQLGGNDTFRVKQPVRWTDCRTVVEDLTFQRHCTLRAVGQQVSDNQEAVNEGPAKWVNSRIMRSTIIMSPEMHARFYGG